MKKNRFLLIILVLFIALICELTVAGIFFSTRMNFPSFTDVTNTLFRFFVSQTKQRESTLEKPEQNFPLPAAILGKNAVFSRKIIPNLVLADLEYSFSDGGFVFEFANDGKILTCTSDVSKISLQKNKATPKIVSWKFESDFEIISHPKVFRDSVVFIDALPNLVVLDLENGTIQNKIPSPILPSGKANATEYHYQFEGLDGVIYAAIFLDSTDVQEKNEIFMESVFSPDIVTQSNILYKLENWQPNFADQPTHEDARFISPIFEEVKPLYQNVLVPLEDIDIFPTVFAFSPKESAKFSVFISDLQGKLKSYPSYVAVFSSEGDLLSVNLDYVATDPIVTLNLDKTKLYYFAFGLLSPLAQGEVISAMIRRQK